MTPQEAARAMLALYGGKSRRWCQGSYCQYDDAYVPVAYVPVAWCLYGAIEHVTGAKYGPTEEAIEKRVQMPIADWNDADDRTFADVVKLLTDIAESP